MPQKILITGFKGLIGSALIQKLKKLDIELMLLDIKATDPNHYGDICNIDHIKNRISDCDGIVHLAAISRVILGERDPNLCWQTNVGGLQNILKEMANCKKKPWLIFASSREVYGQPNILPVVEDSLLQPVNIYGRSKVEGERLVQEAKMSGLRTSIIRLSNVFGSIFDHADRVVPAFAKAAAFDGQLRVDGANHTFDFTHVNDVALGITSLIQMLQIEKETPPPIHFVSEKATTLDELAHLAIKLANSKATITYAPSRSFDVAHFVGCANRAKTLLNWQAQTTIEQGLDQLILDFKKTNQQSNLFHQHFNQSDDVK